MQKFLHNAHAPPICIFKIYEQPPPPSVSFLLSICFEVRIGIDKELMQIKVPTPAFIFFAFRVHLIRQCKY
jgi:hypothetical protein